MNDNELVTRCPDCGTSFRVTEAQLAAAGGAVRCGACLQIFSAVDHLVETESQPEDSQSLSQDKVVQDEVLTPAVRGMTAEDWAEIESDDDWEPEDEALTVPEILAEPETEPGEPEIIDEPIVADQEPVEGAGESGGWQLNVDDEGEILGSEVRVDVDSIDLVEEHLAEESRKPAAHGATLRWFSLSLLALLGLLAQFAWMEMPALSQQVELRPAYQAACNLIGCDLPDYADPHAIRVGELIVRSHPVIDSALAVDATVANLAPFRQAFPVLELRFDAMDGRTMAARRFSPGDYLAGELTGLKYLPARTEVHISLAIVDPGKDAVNYSLSAL